MEIILGLAHQKTKLHNEERNGDKVALPRGLIPPLFLIWPSISKHQQDNHQGDLDFPFHFFFFSTLLFFRLSSHLCSHPERDLLCTLDLLSSTLPSPLPANTTTTILTTAMTQVVARSMGLEGSNTKPTTIPIPPPTADPLSRLRPPPSRNGQINVDTFSPVNENGSFAFDRVLKTGQVFRRVKHKHVFRASWKPAYLVLRPNLLSVYKDEEATRLRVSISLSEVTAVAPVRSPRSNREHVFGIFTPSKNYRFEALSERDAEDWISRIRRETPADEEEAAFLALSRTRNPPIIQKQLIEDTTEHSDFDGAGIGSSASPGSPEPAHGLSAATRIGAGAGLRKPPYTQDYSGNEITSYSELSDNGTPPSRNERLRSMPSIHTMSLSAPEDKSVTPLPRDPPRQDTTRHADPAILRDPERVICQGYLQGLRIKGAVRQWKRLWVVLRPKNLAFYKDDHEYSAIKIISMSQVIDAAEVDPMSRSKNFCMQIICVEKTYRLCAGDEESLARWLGALKSIIVARKKLEAMPSATV